MTGIAGVHGGRDGRIGGTHDGGARKRTLPEPKVGPRSGHVTL